MKRRIKDDVHTGTSAQCYVADWMGGELGKNGYTYMYG